MKKLTPRHLEFRRKLRMGVAHFNQGNFFEAHDVWEELWRSLETDIRRVVQGLIQTAVGAHHLQRKNRRGAQSLFRNVVKNLALGPKKFCGIDLLKLVEDVELLSAQLRENLPEESLKTLAISFSFQRRPKP